jgi:hypothetical protein
VHFLCIPQNSRNSLIFSILPKISSSSLQTGKTKVNRSSLKLINLKIKNLKILSIPIIASTNIDTSAIIKTPPVMPYYSATGNLVIFIENIVFLW